MGRVLGAVDIMKFTFDECLGTTQHAACPVSITPKGHHNPVAECDCPCHPLAAEAKFWRNLWKTREAVQRASRRSAGVQDD